MQAAVRAAGLPPLGVKAFELPPGAPEPALEIQLERGELDIVAKRAILTFSSGSSDKQARSALTALNPDGFGASHEQPRQLHESAYRRELRAAIGQ